MTRPTSIPDGVHIELSRARILAGQSRTCDEWMQTLNARLDECTATLTAERTALEIVFRRSDDDGEWIYWLSIFGEGGNHLDESIPIDREHIAYAKACKEPGWEEAEPCLLLAAPEVLATILDSTRPA